MILRIRSVLAIVTLSAIVFVPFVVAATYVGFGGARDFLEDLGSRFADVIRGRVTEQAILRICAAVMIAAWVRIVWTIAAVLLSTCRGLAYRGCERPLARIVLRVLVLAPIAINTVTPRAQVLAADDSIEAGVESNSTASVRTALLVSAAVAVGVALRVKQRRLAAMRDAESLGRPEPLSTFEELEFESDVARLGHDVAFERFDLAVKSLARAGRADFRWLIQHVTGSIHVEFADSCAVPWPWTAVSDRIVFLDARVSPTALSLVDSNDDVRAPILIPVGATTAGEVWVNLETVGSFHVHGDDENADAVWEGVCQSLALSPLHASVNIVSSTGDGFLGRQPMIIEDARRARQVSRILHCDEAPSVRLECNGPRRSLFVEGVGRPEWDECGLVRRGTSWRLLPMGHDIEPTMCSLRDRRSIATLIDSRPDIDQRSPVSAVSPPSWRNLHPTVTAMFSDVSFVARSMGRPSIDHRCEGEVVFERSRSEELVMWLALHPHRRRRSTARSEMWNIPIKDSTFSNITSDARRSLTACEMPPEGEQWISVTMTDELPLHPRIVSDVSILQRCVDHARLHPEDAGGEVLMFGLEFVRGCPFEGSRYVWRDATGLSTDVAMLIVRAATMCAEMALERGDAQTVHVSSSKGLLAVPGHEGLIALRMQQHARCGDKAALRTEWESYCRALVRDDWGDSRPSQKMVELWSTLSGRRVT